MATQGIRPSGYRLPDDIRLGRVKLQIADLARSLEYYERVLGLREVSRDGDRVVLGPHGDDTAVIELEEKQGVAPVPRRGRLGLYHFAIRVPDRAALGRFVAHLSNVGVSAGASDHLVSEAIYLYDADGLGIEVYADRPPSTWRREAGQLVMATEPLDLRDVIDAAGGEPWTGMPPGTTMGHIHLHVGDLTSAEAFYHVAVGFDKVVWSYPGALFLSVGGYHHHLGVNTWAAGAVPAGAHDARLLEWEILMPAGEDVADVVRSLEGAGHAVSSGLVRDPWGTALRFSPASA